MSTTAKSKASKVVNLAIARHRRQEAITAKQIEQRVPDNNSEKRLAGEGEERRLLWVSIAEAELLSCMYQHGIKPAAVQLLMSGGVK
jgi:hypothetical protein